MDITGSHRISASRETVWQALNDAEILRACIPGCEEIEQTSSTTLTAKVVQKIGPVKAKFEGAIELQNIEAPVSYTISGEGQGGVAGFAMGSADVVLAEEGGETILSYTAHGQVGGKLARLGSRLIDATAKKLAAKFFDSFQDALNNGPPDG
jgi:carbon monoxide dehydrogenase subunit G